MESMSKVPTVALIAAWVALIMSIALKMYLGEGNLLIAFTAVVALGVTGAWLVTMRSVE